MKIVVIAETVQQFKLYVESSMGTQIAKIAERTFTTYGNKVTARIEGEIEYIFCNNKWHLCGYTFTKEDKIVQVGTWYNLPNAEELECNFNSRVL